MEGIPNEKMNQHLVKERNYGKGVNRRRVK